MGALATIIGAISDDVVAALDAASYPPLTPDASGNAGRILIGPATLFEQSAPPRIIFEPSKSKFLPAEYYSPSASLSTVERRNQASLRTIAGENISFVVRCWGAVPDAPGVNSADDYDVTRALYHQVRASLHNVMPGAYEIEESGEFDTTNVVNHLGREFVFGVTFFTPVLSALAPFALSNYSTAQVAAVVDNLYAPDDVQAMGGVTLTAPDGTSEEVENVD
jgi:hypothetical protein